MPGGDGTGPLGQGPYGWGRGFCTRVRSPFSRLMRRRGARPGQGILAELSDDDSNLLDEVTELRKQVARLEQRLNQSDG